MILIGLDRIMRQLDVLSRKFLYLQGKSLMPESPLREASKIPPYFLAMLERMNTRYIMLGQ